MKRWTRLFCGMWVAFVMTVPQTPGQEVVEEAELLVISFHADWCPMCEELQPKLLKVQMTMMNEPILFITLDRTDDDTKFQGGLLASALNLAGHYEDNAGTGYALLISPKGDDGEVLGKLTSKQSVEDMTAAINAALKE